MSIRQFLGILNSLLVANNGTVKQKVKALESRLRAEKMNNLAKAFKSKVDDQARVKQKERQVVLDQLKKERLGSITANVRSSNYTDDEAEGLLSVNAEPTADKST